MENHRGSSRNFSEEMLHSNAMSSSFNTTRNEINQTITTVANQTAPSLNCVLEDNIQQHNHSLEAGSSNIIFSNILNRELPSTLNYNQDQSSDSVIINIADNSVPNRNNSHNSNVNNVTTADNLMSHLRHAINNTNASNNPNSNVPNANAISNVAEVQHSLEFLQKYLPFILILISKCVYDYCDILFNLAIIFSTFVHANTIVKREATQQARRSLIKLAVALLYILACFLFIAFVYESEQLYRNLLFIHTYKHFVSVWFLLWTLLLTDFILKLATIFVKILFTMLPASIVPFQKRGKVYLFVESISQLYRSLVTIQPWLYYLLETYNGAEKIIGVFLSAAYMVSKGSDLMSRLRLLKTAVLKLLQNVALGSSPNKDQIQTAGNHCPICHDEYDSPVLLHCQHIFCENCVSTWFDREQTCPLCRAKIVEDPSWRDGSTTFFVQLF